MQRVSIKEMKKWINSIPDETLEGYVVLCDENGECYFVEGCSVDLFEKEKQTVNYPIVYFNRKFTK